MKKTCLLAILVSLSLFAKAQNPLINPSFETWTWYDANQTMEYPIYWSGDPGPFPIKSTDACEGTYSVLLTDSVYGVSVGGGVGVQQTAYFTGAPPIGVSFCYKYKTTPNDTAQLIATLVSNSYASSVSYSFNQATVWTPVTIYFASYNGPSTDVFQLDVLASCSNAMHVSTDYSQLKIDDVNFVYATGINDLNDLSNQISLFPNPNNGVFTLTNSSKDVLSIKIMNPLGETVYINNTLLSTENKTIDLSNYAKGLYFVELLSETSVSKKKIIIQ